MDTEPEREVDGPITQLYDVYTAADGQRLLVLPGLDPAQPVEFGSLQLFLLEHVDFLIVFYWLLCMAMASYLVGTYVLVPFLKRRS